jgi:hypothetical protein
MGAVCSASTPEERDALKKDREIMHFLQEDNHRQEEIIKLLLLGKRLAKQRRHLFCDTNSVKIKGKKVLKTEEDQDRPVKPKVAIVFKEKLVGLKTG